MNLKAVPSLDLPEDLKEALLGIAKLEPHFNDKKKGKVLE